MADAIVREWLWQVFGMDAARLGMGREIAQFLAIFYADNGYITARSPERLQLSMIILAGMFERVGLLTNTMKTKWVTCAPGRIKLKDVYTNSHTGLVARDEWLCRRV